MKILIVEDDKNIREGVADFLSEFGYNTIEASDGREALAKFDEQDISLVILDIQMPYINGLEVLKEIRKFPCAVNAILLSRNAIWCRLKCNCLAVPYTSYSTWNCISIWCVSNNIVLNAICININ